MILDLRIPINNNTYSISEYFRDRGSADISKTKSMYADNTQYRSFRIYIPKLTREYFFIKIKNGNDEYGRRIVVDTECLPREKYADPVVRILNIFSEEEKKANWTNIDYNDIDTLGLYPYISGKTIGEVSIIDYPPCINQNESIFLRCKLGYLTNILSRLSESFHINRYQIMSISKEMRSNMEKIQDKLIELEDEIVINKYHLDKAARTYNHILIGKGFSTLINHVVYAIQDAIAELDLDLDYATMKYNQLDVTRVGILTEKTIFIAILAMVPGVFGMNILIHNITQEVLVIVLGIVFAGIFYMISRKEVIWKLQKKYIDPLKESIKKRWKKL